MLNRRHILAAAGGLFATGITSMSNAIENTGGFYVPDEAEPHERTFMQWPVSLTVYISPYYLKSVQKSVADIANTVVEFEPVVMLMDKQYVTAARKLLSDKIEIWGVPTEDLWCRDSGPLFLRNETGDLAVSHLNFNGWGNKQVHKKDGRIARRISEILQLPLFDNGLVGEGGGVETNGHGTLIAHESSWVNKNRNNDSKSEISDKLMAAYGVEKVIWAPGIAGEDITDYHIDALARFVDRNVILIQMPDRIYPGDPWSAAAYKTRDILAGETTADGKELEIQIIPDPKRPRIKSPEFVASYVNYYVCNGAVISAEFGDEEADGVALDQLQKAYPDREIVTLNVDPIGKIGGGIHCATQQQPKV